MSSCIYRAYKCCKPEHDLRRLDNAVEVGKCLRATQLMGFVVVIISIILSVLIGPADILPIFLPVAGVVLLVRPVYRYFRPLSQAVPQSLQQYMVVSAEMVHANGQPLVANAERPLEEGVIRSRGNSGGAGEIPIAQPMNANMQGLRECSGVV